jgi:hypothetical protein
MLGRRDDALCLVDEAVDQLVGRIDPDDGAACHARLSLCLSSLGDPRSEQHLEAGVRCRTELRDFQHRLLRQTIEIIDEGPKR